MHVYKLGGKEYFPSLLSLTRGKFFESLSLNLRQDQIIINKKNIKAFNKFKTHLPILKLYCEWSVIYMKI